jgi:L-ascorbate metabolism protein UlaG (beta-lactamase superfamily)
VEVIYVSSDTVRYENVAEVARRFNIRTACLHLGAARVLEVGPFHLTMTAEEAVEASRALKGALIVPLHFEGWAHFSGGRPEIKQGFRDARLEDRVPWLEPSRTVRVR